MCSPSSPSPALNSIKHHSIRAHISILPVSFGQMLFSIASNYHLLCVCALCVVVAFDWVGQKREREKNKKIAPHSFHSIHHDTSPNVAAFFVVVGLLIMVLIPHCADSTRIKTRRDCNVIFLCVSRPLTRISRRPWHCISLIVCFCYFLYAHRQKKTLSTCRWLFFSFFLSSVLHIRCVSLLFAVCV